MGKTEYRQITKIVGDNLRRLRISRGYSQSQFADMFEITQASVSHFEKGDREPGLDFIYQVADRFKVPVTALLPVELYGLSDDVSSLVAGLVHQNPAWYTAFEKARYLSDDESALVIAMICKLAEEKNSSE